jgi:hypothetical protein
MTPLKIVFDECGTTVHPDQRFSSSTTGYADVWRSFLGHFRKKKVLAQMRDLLGAGFFWPRPLIDW